MENILSQLEGETLTNCLFLFAAFLVAIVDVVYYCKRDSRKK